MQERVRLTKIATFGYDCQRKCFRHDGCGYWHASLQFSMQLERSNSPTIQDSTGYLLARNDQGSDSAIENCCHLSKCKMQSWTICGIDCRLSTAKQNHIFFLL